MIEKLYTIESGSLNPYLNMGLEEYLMYHTGREECILYLWQNERTVVIGRNQNAWKECQTEELEGDGGYLARRLSGGGAVFHDLGNLNFTFLVRKENFNVEKQTEVILRAVNSLGIHAEKAAEMTLRWMAANFREMLISIREIIAIITEPYCCMRTGSSWKSICMCQIRSWNPRALTRSEAEWEICAIGRRS